MNLKGKHIVVTGISRGIGLALVKQLCAKGASVYGWGRSAPDYSNANFHFLPCDIRNEDTIKAVAKKTLSMTGNQVDVLINNGGLGFFGYLEEQPMNEIQAMVETNLMGTIYASRAVLPTMKTKGAGHIINLSSTAGIEGYQQVSVYCATKYAITGFSDALYKELKDFGIKVTCVHPGATKTNFFDNVEGITPHDNMMAPAEVAGQLIFVLESSDNFVTNTLVIRPLQSRPSKAR